MNYPNFKEEKKLWKRGFKRVAGIDEAGRGPLAGPVLAAAVVMKKSLRKIDILREVKDSKKLSPKKREKLYKLLTKNSDIEWGVARVSEKIVDKINIKNASELAMERAVERLGKKPDFLIIDGNQLKNHKLKKKNYKLIVKADEKVLSCSIASIIAKVTRDRIMVRYHKKYPKYGFKKHKGYPTKFHFKILEKYGPCKIHRKSFGPVRNLIS
jgi:ribonuclease HII